MQLDCLLFFQGFVNENPTAPIQLKSRRTFPCENDFCRLGCICSSLSHTSRTSHCGWPACMFGCSCLKQKVVLLKHLDSCDSSPSPHHGGEKKKKKGKRRMKMAYGKALDSSSNGNEAVFIRLMINTLSFLQLVVLKEADSVTQPAKRVRTLWRKSNGALDPEPLYIPKMASVSFPVVST